MRFPDPLIPALIIRRYKRFLADVRFADGTLLTVHCPNPGAMTGCAEPGFHARLKSVTLAGRDGLYAFPDAVTARGLKHLRELSAAVRAGHRAAMLFLIQRGDRLAGFRAASEVDPAYAAGLAEARRNGVEVLAYQTTVDEEGITLGGIVPFFEDLRKPGNP